MKLCIV